MSDKQLAVLLQNYYNNLFEEVQNIKSELEDDEKYNKPYRGFLGNNVSYFPILDKLDSIIENISFDIDKLKSDDNPTKQ